MATGVGSEGAGGSPGRPAGLQGPQEASRRPEQGGGPEPTRAVASTPHPGSFGVLVSLASPTHPPWWPGAPWDVTD